MNDDQADVTAGETDAVFRLIYRSHSLIPAEERRTELGEIFTTARRNNKRLTVTGALVIADDSFVQALEGDEAVVRDLYERICEDPRHEQLTVLAEAVIEGRTFGRWAMAKVAADGGPDIRLLSNAGKQVIVAARAAERGVTAEQESVLAFMRGALVADPQDEAVAP